jgi:hypothetical protein
VHNLAKLGTGILLLVAGASHARLPDPIVVTIDGRDHATFTSPVVLSPGLRLLHAPELAMSNCRRADGGAPVFGPVQLAFAGEGTLDAATVQILFKPTRIVLDTLYADVRCDGEAEATYTGVDRNFRGDFEVD